MALLCILMLFLYPRIGRAGEPLQNFPPAAFSQEMNQANLLDALLKNPKNEDLYYQVISLFFDQKMYQEVILVAAKAKAESVLSSRILMTLSKALFLKGQYSDCLTILGYLDFTLSGGA